MRAVNRRKLLKWSAAAAVGSAIGGVAYPLLGAKWCRVTRVTLPVPNLPGPFAGAIVAFLADIHHGPFVPLSYVRRVVAMTNALAPDLVLLGGDYVSKHRRYIAPCVAELGALRARLGRFAVLGNHDHWEGPEETRDALARAGIVALTNAGVWLDRRGARLRLCGVGDLWEDAQDLPAALGRATAEDAVVLLSHNPDYVEQIADRRVGLVLSGHTHGGQVLLPGIEPRWTPSRYGRKYLQGLCQGPACRVYVARGVGTTGPPVRFRCPPEVVLITLQPEVSRS
jgi:uncharacterized protein